MRLRRFLLRYYPPGITIEYEKRGQTRTKEFFKYPYINFLNKNVKFLKNISIVSLKSDKDVNLFELTADDDPMKVAEQVINSEPLVSEKKIDILTGKSHNLTPMFSI